MLRGQGGIPVRPEYSEVQEMRTNGRQATARSRRARWLPDPGPMCSQGCVCRGSLTVAQCEGRFDVLVEAILAETP